MPIAGKSPIIAVGTGVTAIAIVLAGSFVLVTDMKLNVDETFHYPQIKNFLEHDFRLSPTNSMLPGYHYFVFALAWLFGAKSVNSIRFISFCIALVSMGVFYVFARDLRKQESTSKTFQYVFFPLLYPFFFVIYTEVLSITLVLLAIYLGLRKRHYLAGLIGILSCLVRQDNIAWVGLMFLLMIPDVVRAGEVDAVRRVGEHQGAMATIRSVARNGAAYLSAFALFAAFVLVNKGVAVDRLELPPRTSVLYLGNVYLLLFSFFFLFLPMNLANAPKILALVSRHRLSPFYIAGLFAVFLGTFTVDHPYNTEPWAQWFLSNQILAYFQQDVLRKTLFFVPIVYSILSLLTTKVYEARFNLVYPVSILFLAPHWLIDPRYYLIPLVLFLLFKEDDSKSVRYLTYALYVMLSGYFLLVIVSYDFFF